MKMYFDIGGNIGDYTQFLLKKGAEKVITVEANPGLSSHLKLRFTGSLVEVINKAISSETNPIDFWICDECNVISTCDTEWMNNSRFASDDRKWRQIKVETISVDNLIELYGIPEHIKIDVEGYEYNALQSMTKNYAQVRFEWAEEKKKEMLLSIDYLHKIGYDAFGFTLGDAFDAIPDFIVNAEDIKYWIEENLDENRKDTWGMMFAFNEGDSYVD